MTDQSAENDAAYIPTWRVSIPVEVTASTREEAIRYALDDLRDPSMDWDYFEVQQLDGPHPKHGPGLCPVCGHYGDDCEGYVIPPGKEMPKPIMKVCTNCGAERQLYHPCPKCGQPTFRGPS